MNMKATLQRLTGMKTDLAQAAQDLRQGLDSAREGLAAKREELDRVQRLPGPPAEVIAGLEREVDAANEHYGKEHGRQLLLRSAGLLVPAHLAGRDTAVPSRRPELPFDLSRPLTFGEHAFLFPEAVKQALRQMVLAADYEAGPPAEARGPLLERLSREVAELEQAEEALVDELAAAGVQVPHRVEVQARRTAEERQRQRDQEQAEHTARVEAWRRAGEHPLATHQATLYPDKWRDRA
jgi:hypothetical protein